MAIRFNLFLLVQKIVFLFCFQFIYYCYLFLKNKNDFKSKTKDSIITVSQYKLKYKISLTRFKIEKKTLNSPPAGATDVIKHQSPSFRGALVSKTFVHLYTYDQSNHFHSVIKIFSIFLNSLVTNMIHFAYPNIFLVHSNNIQQHQNNSV